MSIERTITYPVPKDEIDHPKTVEILRKKDTLEDSMPPEPLAYQAKPLQEVFKTISDPREAGKVKHDLSEVMTYMSIVYATGHVTMESALDWASHNLDYLRQFMKLENGIASISTVSRIFSRISERENNFAFMQWTQEIHPVTDRNMGVDGKGQLGSTDRMKGAKTPYIMNANDLDTGVIFGQFPIPEKANEMSALPEFLETLPVEGNMISIDAIGTCTNVMKSIFDAGGHALLYLKKNNPATYAENVQLFKQLKSDAEKMKEAEKAGTKYDPACPELMESYTSCEEFEDSKGRLVNRFVQACDAKNGDVCAISREEEVFSNIQTVACVTQIRREKEKDADGNDITRSLDDFLKLGSVRKPVQPVAGDAMSDAFSVVGMLSDLKLTASEILDAKISHWGIENSLHHVLDKTFREDESLAKKSKSNLALIRKYAFNTLSFARIREKMVKSKSIAQMMRLFRYEYKYIEKYFFNGIYSLY